MNRPNCAAQKINALLEENKELRRRVDTAGAALEGISREAFHLAMYVIQSDLYTKDMDARDATDNILLATADMEFRKPKAKQALEGMKEG